jgi:hypothetical protein
MQASDRTFCIRWKSILNNSRAATSKTSEQFKEDIIMQKPARASRRHSNAIRPYRQQRRSHSSIKWIIVSIFCLATCFCLLGVASAAQSSGGPDVALAQKQKQQILLQQIGNRPAHPQPKKVDPNAHAPAVQPAPARQAGISNAGQGPFSPAVFTMRNSWQGPVGKDWVFAYAGAKTRVDGTPGQGSIVLYTQTANAFGGYDFHPLGIFVAPSGTTALTIIEVNGTWAKVHSDTGQTLIFNLLTHQFQ